jgi:hypothetical protein
MGGRCPWIEGELVRLEGLTIVCETTGLFENLFFELGTDISEPFLEPRIGFRSKGSRHQIVACVNTPVYRAQLENKAPIHHQSSVFGAAVTLKANKSAPGRSYKAVVWLNQCRLRRASPRKAGEVLHWWHYRASQPMPSHNKPDSRLSIGAERCEGIDKSGGYAPPFAARDRKFGFHLSIKGLSSV